MNSFNIPQRRIFINGRFLTQQTSGVQVFARGLTRELLTVLPQIIILTPKNGLSGHQEFSEVIQKTGRLSGHLWEQIDLPRFMKNQEGSILINLCNTGPVGIENQMVTIHDLAFIKNPEWFHPAFSAWYRLMVPRLLNKSKWVLTVSETIKNEIITKGFAEGNKITVVGNKVADELLGAKEIQPENDRIVSKKFFLLVGSADPRKNFAFVKNFFTEYLPEATLVISGGRNINFRKEKHNPSDKTIHLGYTSMGELKWLYKNAIALINPSLYEGFGIPNLEAMAFGCPVICSDIPVFREICGKAVCYFELNNKNSLGESIHRVMENKMLTETATLEGKGIFTQIQNQNRSSKIIKALFQ